MQQRERITEWDERGASLVLEMEFRVALKQGSGLLQPRPFRARPQRSQSHITASLSNGVREGLLEDKWAMITGPGKGIGKAIAVRFAEEGARLVLAGRKADILEEVAEECRQAGSPEVEIFLGDGLEAGDVEDLAENVATRIDILVNNAGMAASGDLQDSLLVGDVDVWERMITLNLITPMRLTRILSPHLAKRKPGYIINIGSQAGLHASKGNAAYAASKWGMTGWSQSSFLELREHDIRVTTLFPHYVQSSMTEGVDIPAERMIKPEDVAEAALLPFRLSELACPTEIMIGNAMPIKSPHKR
ncbi:g5928 [Coccomyxa viridis]|uniref:G5928 protein n=1 Tax=Coccomyxa viridis TaxID=1274662 RepID=A0ABP1FWM7_9CHLO